VRTDQDVPHPILAIFLRSVHASVRMPKECIHGRSRPEKRHGTNAAGYGEVDVPHLFQQKLVDLTKNGRPRLIAGFGQEHGELIAA
jgi:hypothetical protein